MPNIIRLPGRIIAPPTTSKLAFDGTWDLETEDWATFVMGGIHTKHGTETYDDEDAMFDALMSLPPGTYWAHNGGRFDTIWLVEMLLKRGVAWTGALRGSSIIEVVVNGNLHFRDSLAVFPEKLSIVAEAGGAQKSEVGIPCVCKLRCTGYCSVRGVPCKCLTTCGGYCSIKRKMPAGHRRLVRDYMVHDCEGLQKGLVALADYCSRNEIDLRTTIGASAWNTCARWLHLDTRRPAHSLYMYHALRKGYYGGRNETYDLGTPRDGSTPGELPWGGRRFDIHSSYPAALSAIALPTGDMRSANPGAAYARGHDGVYTARVSIPECHSPPLPIRTADRLVYCYGDIEGTWTGIELRHAESCGATITQIVDGIYCEKSERVLKPYADRVWGLREKAKKEERDGIYRWVKWLANSLTGKLAMAPSVVTLACVPEDKGMKPGETRILHKHGMLVLAKETDRVGSCAHVEWAAHLTSYARGPQLHAQLVRAGTDAIYCDTDSVYTRANLDWHVGDALGEWGLEGTMMDWQCLAPKIYRYWDNDKQKYIVRGKGMSRLHAEGFDALRRGEAWHVKEGVSSLKVAIQKKQGIFVKKSLSRKLAPEGDFVGSRRRLGTTTRAVDYAEFSLARAE